MNSSDHWSPATQTAHAVMMHRLHATKNYGDISDFQPSRIASRCLVSVDPIRLPIHGVPLRLVGFPFKMIILGWWGVPPLMDNPMAAQQLGTGDTVPWSLLCCWMSCDVLWPESSRGPFHNRHFWALNMYRNRTQNEHHQQEVLIDDACEEIFQLIANILYGKEYFFVKQTS